MLFNSYIFVLFFLPLALIFYFGLNHLGRQTIAKLVLTGMSLWFYAYFHISYLFLIIGSVLFNFVCSKLLLRQWGSGIRKGLLTFGILANGGVIFYFKYFNFFIDNVNLLLKSGFAVGEILMPLGISFFTFQQISYLVDSYRGETKEYGFIDYALFVTFFPQLVAGPIVLHQEMIPQFNDPVRKKLNQDKLARGIWMFSIGLFKKVMLADVLGQGVEWGFDAVSVLTGPEVLIVSLLYTLQLYFDFSGYCDMACGIANMFHLDLPVNFLSPYKSASIEEFWGRWHITLGRFLRKYVYFPLGGSRKGTIRTFFNIIIVFLVSGIWHGAAWTFIIWGLLHGAGSILYRCFRSVWDRFPLFLRRAGTFVFLQLTWILFRADSLSDAAIMYSKLFRPWEFRVSGELLGSFDLLEFTYIEDHVSFLNGVAAQYPWGHMMIVIVLGMLLIFLPKNCQEKKFVPTVKNAVGSMVLLIWSLLSFSGLSVFLYFNF